MRDKVLDEMKISSARNLNSLDEIVVYQTGRRRRLENLELMLNDENKPIAEKEIGLAMTESVLAHLQKKASTSLGRTSEGRSGATNNRRCVAEAVLMGEIDEGETHG